MKRLLVLRLISIVTLMLGVNYLSWRWFFSLNMRAWWIAIPLVVAETYNLIDVAFFSLTMWRVHQRELPPPAQVGLSIDVFITTYNEPVSLVEATARAAIDISYPHKTWILDDGARDEMREAAENLGVGYITRSSNWKNRPLHAKAGNLNNALMATTGEFLLILDADQIARPTILDHTLGYFDDPKVAFVQTPQIFGNVSTSDPLGSQAPLFYGPIQQGKDGWNAAYFCGSNAILRREALMQLGITRYVLELESAIATALQGAAKVLRQAKKANKSKDPSIHSALESISASVEQTRTAIANGKTLGTATYDLQQQMAKVSRELVSNDLHLMASDLEAIRKMHTKTDENWDVLIDINQTVNTLAARDLSPLGAIESVQTLIRSIDVDRSDEAQPLMPLATISVTEDMATSMRLHALGWKSVYHHELLAIGLAPEDIGAMLSQRLRWAQGTMQVMLRENPLFQRGMSVGQRLMYFSTMWGYLNGFAAAIYFTAPVIFLCFGILPVRTTSLTFFLHFLPFMIGYQVLFAYASRGTSTWRGTQYSLALFPVWIQATTSAIANVFFHRPLGFVVTPKTRQETKRPWRLVRIQMATAAILVAASVVGIVRAALGSADPIGILINSAWVVFNLVSLSVLIPAVRYQGFKPKEATS